MVHIIMNYFMPPTNYTLLEWIEAVQKPISIVEGKTFFQELG